MDTLFHPDYSNMWTALGALSQGLASIMAIAALFYSMTTFRKSLQTSHYTELDAIYFDLLKIALEKPHLDKPVSKRTDKQKVEYDIYAFMIWNFLETIYDRCEENRHLCATWYPILSFESMKNRDWFDRPDNKCKFKDGFHEFIQRAGFAKNSTSSS